MDWVSIWQSIKDIFTELTYGLINLIISAIGLLIDAAAALLPEWDPITALTITNDYGAINALNWVFPVQFAVNMVALFALSTLAWFTIGTVTRWAKITGGS